ncbi:MAG: hypothetical protein U1E22_01145, partial [Coriobacteriia bacterium]|nr:hypothetical protein [Coriobacteriia bacterium]
MSEVNRVLFLRTDSVGDSVLASGMLPHIRDHYFQAELSVLCEAHVAELYEHSPFVDRVLVYDNARMWTDDQYVRGILAGLQQKCFDVALNTV